MGLKDAFITFLRGIFLGARDVKRANDADHAKAVEEKADIDRRHIERRDLSKDPRPKP